MPNYVERVIQASTIYLYFLCMNCLFLLIMIIN